MTGAGDAKAKDAKAKDNGPNGDDPAVDVYTDGACSGNPGPGGWGAVLSWRGETREIKGGEPETTNNRMELMAAIRALETLSRPVAVRLHTDSVYLKDGVTRWIHRWKTNGWKTAAHKPVKNVDLWQRLDTALARHRVEWRWVKGHAGDAGNERADVLARRGMAPYLDGGRNKEKARAPKGRAS